MWFCWLLQESIEAETAKSSEALKKSLSAMQDRLKAVSISTNTTRPFRHLSCTDLNHIWNNRRDSVCQSIHLWEISEFLCRGFASPKKLPRKRYFGWSLFYQHTAQTEQFLATGIILRAIRHPKDAPFVHAFWWRMYSWHCDPPNEGHFIMNTTPFSVISARRKNTV